MKKSSDLGQAELISTLLAACKKAEAWFIRADNGAMSGPEWATWWSGAIHVRDALRRACEKAAKLGCEKSVELRRTKLTSAQAKNWYPLTAAMGLAFYTPESGPDYVLREDLAQALRKAGLTRRFDKIFGVQTQSMDGVYAGDIEAALERLKTRRRTGSQLYWD